MSGAGLVVDEALRVGALWGLNLVGLGAADRLARGARLGPEAARKFIHIVAGLLAVPLPWVLRSNVAALVLCAGGLAGLVVCRRLGLLKSLHGVERTSAGDLLFPVGIALLFLVGAQQPMLYLIGLSSMVISDALAALVGQRYGRATYAVELQRKSIEGSVTFFVVSFVAAHLLLLLGTQTPRVIGVLVATQLALLATAFEAIGTKGNDNLFVPLVACLVAARLVEMPAAVLARDLLVQVAIGAAVALATARWRFAGTSGAITLAVFLYGAYALGGLRWLAAPVAVGVAYVGLRALRWRGRTPSEPHHQVLAVFNVVVVGAALYLLAAVVDALVPGQGPGQPGQVLLVPYLGTAAAQLALLVYTLWRPWDAPLENLEPGCLPALLAALVVAPLAWLVPGGAERALLWVVLAPLIALAAYRRVRAGASWPRAVPWNTRLQAAAVVVALLIVAPLHLALFVH